MNTRIRLALLVFVAMASPVFSADLKQQFVNLFTQELEKQNKQFYTNRKITAVAKNFKIETSGDSAFIGQLQDEWTVVTIYNSLSEHCATITESKILQDRVGNGSYNANGLYYRVTKDNGRYKLSDINLRSNPNPLSGAKSLSQPTAMYSNIHSIPTIMYLIENPRRLNANLEFKSISSSTFRGKECLAVRSTFQNSYGTSDEVSYFDPTNAHAFLGSTAKRPAKMGHDIAHTRHDVMEYHTPPGAKFPVPKRYTCHFEFEGKDPILHVEVDFVGFDDYVPDPEEFKLEKRYGLTTPAGPEDMHLKGSVGRRVDGRFAYWWVVYLLVGVLVVVLGLLIYRRRRQQSG